MDKRRPSMFPWILQNDWIQIVQSDRKKVHSPHGLQQTLSDIIWVRKRRERDSGDFKYISKYNKGDEA